MQYTPPWWQCMLGAREVLVSDEFSEEEAKTLVDHFKPHIIAMDAQNPVKIAGVPQSLSPHAINVAILHLCGDGRVQTQIWPHSGNATYTI